MTKTNIAVITIHGLFDLNYSKFDLTEGNTQKYLQL